MPSGFAYSNVPSNVQKGSVFQSVQPTVTPVGVIDMFAGSIAPNGWLICDGSIVSRKTYSDLFKVIGTTYGTGNSNDTFNLPDMRGRFAMGAGTGSGLTARTLGANYGAESVTLDNTSLPVHAHSNTVSGGNTGYMNTNASHTHSGFSSPLLKYVGSGGNRADLAGGISWIGTDSSPTTVNSQSTDHLHSFSPSISNVNTGSGGSHANIPPALAINYIIKI